MRINIKGPIIDNSSKWIYDVFDIECTCPKDVSEALDAAPNENAEVLINSGGGSVHSGSEIYTMLKSHQGSVDIKIVGLAASAASVIAMAGNKVSISPTANMMIHNASTFSIGDKNDMAKTFEMLDVTDRTIANAYKIKSGMSEEQLLSMMNDETWFSPEKAKELGLVDEILFQDDNVPEMVASTDENGMIPPKVVNKLRHLIKGDMSIEDLTNEKPEETKRVEGLEINLKLNEMEGFDDLMNTISEHKRWMMNAGLVDEDGNSIDDKVEIDSDKINEKITTKNNESAPGKTGYSRFY